MALIKPDGQVIQGAPAVQTSYKSTGRVLNNWLVKYLEYTANNEAPQDYHTWIGLGTLAGSAQRKIFMETEYFSVLSNLYIILVGPPGTKKSTAIRQGKKILRRVPNIHFTTSATSVTGLIQQFTAISAKEHQSLTAFSSELGSMLGISKLDMVDFLVDIFDGEPDWDKQTAAHGKEKIPRPWLNLMAGTTPTWLGDNMPRTAVEGGLFSRSIFVHSEELILKSPFTKKTAEYLRLQEALVNDLAHISVLNGEFVFDPDAEKWYNEWYLDRKRFPKLMDGRLAGYYMRKHVHLLKVAMMLSVAEKDSLVLTLPDLMASLQMLDNIEAVMPRAFASVGGNIAATDMERILKQVRETGGMSIGEVLAHNLHSIRREIIEDLLSNLVDMGEIKRIIRPGGGQYYTPAE